MIIAQIKPYVYETINGKRKRVSPFVFSNDGKTIKHIHSRAIVNAIDVNEKDCIAQ